MSLWDNRDWMPLLLTEKKEAFNSKDYLFEVKFDGIRALLYIGPNSFSIRNRHKKEITYLYPELLQIQELVKVNTILDGEIILMDNGLPSFLKLQERAHLKDKNKIKIQSRIHPVIFIAFDILYQNKDLIKLPLISRKSILDKISNNDYFIKNKYIIERGVDLFSFTKNKKLEGIVAKRLDSIYSINKRSKDWIKIKNFQVEEFVIGGYQKKENGSISLLLGEYIENKLSYVGSVILFSNRELYRQVLHSKILKTSSFVNYKREGTIYISPKYKCKVKYMERTKINHLRQPFIIFPIKNQENE